MWCVYMQLKKNHLHLTQPNWAHGSSLVLVYTCSLDCDQSVDFIAYLIPLQVPMCFSRHRRTPGVTRAPSPFSWMHLCLLSYFFQSLYFLLILLKIFISYFPFVSDDFKEETVRSRLLMSTIRSQRC